MLSFGGGLMVTCGLRNVGVPSEGQGQHGDFTFQKATVEAVERSHEALDVRWDAAALPRMWQWVHPAPGLGVLGLEPANCSVLGIAHDRAEGRLPELAPGEERRTRLEIRALREPTRKGGTASHWYPPLGGPDLKP